MADLERSLAERKELIVLRSTLNRARLRYQLVALRARVPSRGAGLAGIALFAFARLGLGRWIAQAGRMLTLARTIQSALGLLRRR